MTVVVHVKVSDLVVFPCHSAKHQQ